MHDFSIPDDAIEAVTARLGRPHAVVSLDPRRTALIVVDMQNYFMAEGQQLETPVARDVVPTVNALAGTVREAGGHVVWIHNVAPRDAGEAWSSYEMLHQPTKWETRQKSLTEGDFGYELWETVDARPDDIHVIKNRFSAFIQGSSDLDEQLRSRGIDTLLIAGVATNICCETTARDAMMLNYRVVMVPDACAAPTDDLHAASLINFYRFFGDVQDAGALIGMVKPDAAIGRAAE